MSIPKDMTITVNNGKYSFVEYPCTTFDYPQGTPIITRIPTQAHESEETTECILDGQHKWLVCNSTLSPQMQTIEKSYEIKEAGTMGLGMLATRDIEAGDLIIDERPLLLLPSALVVMSSSIPGEIYINLAVLRMSRNDREKFMELMNSITMPGLGESSGKALTNAFKLPELDGIGMGKEYICVLRDIARVNHSCVPNAMLCMFNPETFSCSSRALKRITKGDQIFRNYLDREQRYTANLDQRQSFLSPFSITCTCSLCRLSGSDLEACNAFRAGLDERVLDLFAKLKALIEIPEEYLRCIDLPESHVKDVLDEAWNLELEMDKWEMSNEYWARVRYVMRVLHMYSLQYPPL